jgi:hypothetical protein
MRAGVKGILGVEEGVTGKLLDRGGENQLPHGQFSRSLVPFRHPRKTKVKSVKKRYLNFAPISPSHNAESRFKTRRFPPQKPVTQRHSSG